jgi:hypothetical protein
MQELGNAINETLSDSDRIAERLARSSAPVMTFSPRSSKPTIGFNKRDEENRRGFR